MPLKPGSSRKTIETNIHEMVAAGHPVKQAVAASLHNAHYKRKHAIDRNASAHDAGHPDHETLREEKMERGMRGAKVDHAAIEFAEDRMDRMGSHGREPKMGRPRQT